MHDELTMRGAFLILVLCVAGSAVAKTDAQTELDRAVKLFNDFEDGKATAVLNELLKHEPSADQAAKAHVYLGLIALNALKSDRARLEFKQALNIDATTELPFDAAPKARLAFDQAQREVEREAREKAPEAQRPVTEKPIEQQKSSPIQVVVVTSEAQKSQKPVTENRPVVSARSQSSVRRVTVDDSPGPTPASAGPSFAPAIVVAGVGLGTLIGGAVMGALSNSAMNQANQAVLVGPAEQYASQVGTDGLVADICFGIGGAALATGIVLFIIELNGQGAETSSRVHSDGHGVAVVF